MAIIDITKPMALDETLQGTNTKMDAVILKLQGIIDALGLDTSVYKPKGNIACAQLVPALLIESNIGNVYNVTDNGTTTSDFAEGAGKPIHVGDNVAIVDIGTGGQSEYKFDLLAGMVDLTNYVQKSQTAGLLKNDGTIDTKDYAEKVAGATNGNLAGLNGSGNPTDSGWNGAKDTTSISGNPISISGLKANQLAVNPIITLEPIQAGSGTPSPSNIRAISGYDKIEVLSCGRNLFDISKVLVGTVSGNTWTISSSALATKLYDVKFKTNTSYTFSGTELQSATNLNTRLIIYYTDGTRDDLFTDRGTTAQSFTFTSNASKTVSYLSLTYGTSGGTVTITNFQIEEGSTATTYVPYVKTTDLSESLGQTVYGGTHEVRTGKAKIKYANLDLSTLSWSYNSGWNCWASSLSAASVNSNDTPINAKADRYDIVKASGYTTSHSANTLAMNTNKYLFIDNGSTTTSPTGQLVYELATYGEIQLTPHEISLLKDYAYVSTNGTNIQFDYHNGELASLSDVAQVGETVNELGGKLNEHEITTFSERVSLGSYTQANPYVTPCDGYLSVYTPGARVAAVIMDSSGETTSAHLMSFGFLTAQSGEAMTSIFVRKGMRVYINPTYPVPTGGIVYFYKMQ